MTYRMAPALMLLFAAGCSAGGRGYPSLAVRPAEARGWAEPATPPPAAVVADPALDAQIATATTALAGNGRDFDAAARRAAPLVGAARGQAAGSERWIAAQSALAELDAQRAAASDTATTIEDLAGSRAQTGLIDYPALEAARGQATALLDREAARIKALQATIPAG
ncbi:hypothetical protein [uncultured Sphingomonas sp.]|uniref:hypothetical protein n=1 Tax=uncultured Sphingomonas sp. TaxID=158754 RepID=UPI0035CC2CBC